MLYSHLAIESNQSIVNQEDEAGKIDLQFAFMGGERIYYQFMYESQYVKLDVNSNIIVDGKNIEIQWFDVELELIISSEDLDEMAIDNVTDKYVVLPLQIIRPSGTSNLTVTVGYSTRIYMLSENKKIFEKISMYDIVIENAEYAELLKHYRLSSFDHCLTHLALPVYSWFEVSLSALDHQYYTTVTTRGLNLESISRALTITSCILPLINMVMNSINELFSDNVVMRVSNRLGIDIVDITSKITRVYLESKYVYRDLYNTLTKEYCMLSPRIEITFNQTNTAISIDAIIQDANIYNLSLESIDSMLKYIVSSISIPSTGSLYLYEALTNAQVIDLRSPAKNAILFNPFTWTIIVATVMLSSLQIAIIVWTIIKDFRSLRKI
uniref:Uncharacterized protein n=1 Tax=Ignisphaera aggregans TaxID=334771 RepID=A0A7C2ZQH2_9CREN